MRRFRYKNKPKIMTTKATAKASVSGGGSGRKSFGEAGVNKEVNRVMRIRTDYNAKRDTCCIAQPITGLNAIPKKKKNKNE